MRRLIPLLFLLATCASNQTDPVTGKGYYSPLGNDYESQDKYIRQNFITEIATASDGGRLPEPEIEAACREVFQDIVGVLPPQHRRGFEYQLVVSPSPEINAYTYGGGRVHCHLGLIAFCESASELAGVLAHEIGHISHDHVGQSMGRRSRLSAITSIGGIAGRPGRRLTETIGGLFGGISLVRYSRKQESEADKLAVQYTWTAEYDPDGTATFFERLGKLSGSRGPALFSTHPPPKNRVKAIRAHKQTYGKNSESRVSTPTFEAARARARKILRYYDAMHKALAGEDMDKVIAAADKGIDALPHHPQFHFWKGLALEIKEERAKALVSLRTAAEQDDANVLPPYLLSALAFEAKEFQLAEWAATRVIRLIPKIPAAYLVRGVSRLALGRKVGAYADFDKLLALVDKKSRKQLVEQIREVAPDYSPR